MNVGSTPATEHEDVFALLPWSINGTLPASDQLRVEQHLLGCDDCRREARQQRRLHEAMRRETSNLDYAPQPAFERLWSRIEELEREVPTAAKALDDAAPDVDLPKGEIHSTRWLLAASVILAFAAGIYLGGTWRAPPLSTPLGFQTATTPTVAPGHGPRVRAVFAPATTVEELTRVVRGTGLTIVAGPTDAGVYTLALDRSTATSIPAAIETALARLRSDPRVRFAEPVFDAGGPQ